MKKPSLNTKAWLSNSKLKLCSFEAKGAWIDIICYMYESEKPGYLYIGSKYLNKEGIRDLLKMDAVLFEKVYEELMRLKILKINEKGEYYSSYIVTKEKPKQQKLELKDKDFEETVKQVIKYFNKKTGRNISESSRDNIILVKGVYKMGYRFKDIVEVIDDKVEEWQDSYAMKSFLSLPVLLSKKNFERYLVEKRNCTISNKVVNKAMKEFVRFYEQTNKGQVYALFDKDRFSMKALLNKIAPQNKKLTEKEIMDLFILFLKKLHLPKNEWILKRCSIGILNNKYEDIVKEEYKSEYNKLSNILDSIKE